MRGTKAKRRAVTAVLVGGLIAGACGGDDDDATTATTAPADTATETTDADDDGTESTAPTDTDGSEGTAPTGTDDAGTPTTAASGDESDADVCTEDRVGGEATIGLLSYPPGMDPVKNRGTGTNGNLIPLAIFDTLMSYDQETDEFTPEVAESLEPNAEFTEWTLTLREGVTFGNGDPLTAEVVQASFARHQDPANRSTVNLESTTVTEMEVVDDLTLVFRLSEPWARFPALLTHVPGMVTNQAVVDELGAEAFNSDPAGGGVGPYELERWAPGEEIVLRAKEDWWGGPVCIETLRFTLAPGGQATYDAFRSGEFQLGQIRDAAVVAAAREDGVEGLSASVNASAIFSLNTTSGPTADPLVRQAMAAAIDPQVINERVYGGLSRATTALIAEHSVHYNGVEGPQPDPARAAELVEEAKAGGWDGSLTMLCASAPETQEACLTAKAMMDAAGMNVTIEPVEVNDLIPRVLSKNYSAASFGFAITDADPWLRLSSGISSDGALNAAGYASPEMDAALDALRVASDDEAFQAALAEVQAIWNQDIPSIVYQAAEDWVAIDDSVKGVAMIQNANLYFNEAYIEE